jgi:hypothetical protein
MMAENHCCIGLWKQKQTQICFYVHQIQLSCLGIVKLVLPLKMAETAALRRVVEKNDGKTHFNVY